MPFRPDRIAFDSSMKWNVRRERDPTAGCSGGCLCEAPVEFLRATHCVAVAAEIVLGVENTRRPEAYVERLRVLQSTSEQSGANQQHQAHRHLQNHEGTPESRRPHSQSN